MPAQTTSDVECVACGVRFTPTETRLEMCDHCNRYYFRCAMCQRVVRQSYRSTRNQTACRGCYPTPCFDFTPIGVPPFLGVEVEVESNESDFRHAYAETLRLLPESFATLKEDGSLSEYGYEIVSRPASYVEHVAAWTPFFQAVRDGKLGQLTAWSNDSCGLHVHICRDAALRVSPFDTLPPIDERWKLDQHTIALIVCFVNLPRNRRFIETIAGRNSNSYTNFQRKRMATAATRTGFKYEAVNLEHSASLEFRIFKGTLRAQSFFKALEFVLALSEFCRSTFNVRKAMALSTFIRYVNENASKYPNLDSFIQNRWYGKRDRNGAAVWRLVNNRKPPLPPIEHGSRSTEGGR